MQIGGRADGDCGPVINYTPDIDCAEYCECKCSDDMAEEAALNYADLITNYSGGGSRGKSGKSGSNGLKTRVDIDANTVSGKGKAGKSGSSRRERELSGKGKGGKGYSDNRYADAAVLAILARATDVASKCECACTEDVINFVPEPGATEEVIIVVTPKPTPKPSSPPTKSPTERPTFNPTKSPTTKPTARPSPAPTPVRSSSLLSVRFI